MSKRRGVDSKPNRELTKNILRGRTCSTCHRLNNRRVPHCEICAVRPKENVCSQWKMNNNARFRKQWEHKITVAKKRKSKKEAKKERVAAV